METREDGVQDGVGDEVEFEGCGYAAEQSGEACLADQCVHGLADESEFMCL